MKVADFWMVIPSMDGKGKEYYEIIPNSVYFCNKEEEGFLSPKIEVDGVLTDGEIKDEWLEDFVRMAYIRKGAPWVATTILEAMKKEKFEGNKEVIKALESVVEAYGQK